MATAAEDGPGRGASVPPNPAAGVRRPASHTRCPVRHCWVTDAVDGRGVRPGFLVEWRRHEGRWQGRVLYPAFLGPGWVVVEEWLPTERLIAGGGPRTDQR